MVKVESVEEFVEMYGSELYEVTSLAALNFFRNAPYHDCELCDEGIEHDTTGFVRKVEHG